MKTLTELYRASLGLGEFPMEWEMVRAVPIHGSDSEHKADSVRAV